MNNSEKLISFRSVFGFDFNPINSIGGGKREVTKRGLQSILNNCLSNHAANYYDHHNNNYYYIFIYVHIFILPTESLSNILFVEGGFSPLGRFSETGRERGADL